MGFRWPANPQYPFFHILPLLVCIYYKSKLKLSSLAFGMRVKEVGTTQQIIRSMWANSNGEIYFVKEPSGFQDIFSLTHPPLRVRTTTDAILLSGQPVYDSLYFRAGDTIYSFNLEDFEIRKQYDLGWEENIVSITKYSQNSLLALDDRGCMMVNRDWQFKAVGPADDRVLKLKLLNQSEVLQKLRNGQIQFQSSSDVSPSYWRLYNLQYGVCTFELKKKKTLFFENIAQYSKHCLFFSLYDLDENIPQSCIIDRRNNKKVYRIVDKHPLEIVPQHVHLVNNKIVALANSREPNRWSGKMLVSDIRSPKFMLQQSFEGRVEYLVSRGPKVYSCFYKRGARIGEYVKTVYECTL